MFKRYFGLVINLVPFLLYLVIPLLVQDSFLSYILKIVLAGGFVIFFWDEYSILWKTNYVFPVYAGIVIFIFWVGLEGLYPLLGLKSQFVPLSLYHVFAKLVGMVLLAPVVEELFVRNFLYRFIIDTDFVSVRHGLFSWPAFIITSLFFGFAHSRWLVGLVTGILLNIVYIRHKNVGSCIVAHYVANLLLAVFVLVTGAWHLW